MVVAAGGGLHGTDQEEVVAELHDLVISNPPPATKGQPVRCPLILGGPTLGITTVEVAQDDEPDDDGPDAGRNWVVRLQRGHDTVTIGRDLGRFSAMALAGDLRRLVGPTHREEAPSSRT